MPLFLKPNPWALPKLQIYESSKEEIEWARYVQFQSGFAEISQWAFGFYSRQRFPYGLHGDIAEYALDIVTLTLTATMDQGVLRKHHYGGHVLSVV